MEKIYIEYLNRKKNFQKDEKEFETEAQAKKWALKNLQTFNPDMIKYRQSHKNENR